MEHKSWLANRKRLNTLEILRSVLYTALTMYTLKSESTFCVKSCVYLLEFMRVDPKVQNLPALATFDGLFAAISNNHKIDYKLVFEFAVANNMWRMINYLGKILLKSQPDAKISIVEHINKLSNKTIMLLFKRFPSLISDLPEVIRLRNRSVYLVVNSQIIFEDPDKLLNINMSYRKDGKLLDTRKTIGELGLKNGDVLIS